jgi:hypothetical protein
MSTETKTTEKSEYIYEIVLDADVTWTEVDGKVVEWKAGDRWPIDSYRADQFLKGRPVCPVSGFAPLSSMYQAYTNAPTVTAAQAHIERSIKITTRTVTVTTSFTTPETLPAC